MDQKAKADAGKLRLTLVPRMIIRAIAHVRMYGVAKYPDGGTDNWRQVEVERYRDAAYRHFMAYLDDPYGVDEESGLSHLWHLATNVAFLCDLEDEQIDKMDAEKEDLKHDGCGGCRYTDRAEYEYPCSDCCHAHTDKYAR